MPARPSATPGGCFGASQFAPDVRAFLTDLHTAGVRFVVTGSAAAAAYGVPVEPRDFDIAPDLAPENLERLAELLRTWKAKPVFLPEWEHMLTPEQIEAWEPEPATPEQLDHLMTTRHGLFDPVPEISGRYEELAGRALSAPVDGFEVLVAHPDDLLAQLRLHREKHQRREPHLRAARDRLPSFAVHFKK